MGIHLPPPFPHPSIPTSTLKTNYPYRWRHLKINHPSLHALKKYVSGPSFSLLHDSWLRKDPFSCFGHLTNYPYRWRHLKINHYYYHYSSPTTTTTTTITTTTTTTTTTA